MANKKESEFDQYIQKAIAAWKEGRLVAIPTETVYGLGAPVDQESLVKSIFKVKERPFFDPLIVHISSIEMAKKYGRIWSETHQRLASSFWPGPLTIVLPKSNEVSALITSGLDTVGIRMPNHRLTLELIATLGVGVAAPSANKFTKTSPTCAQHVRDQFSEEEVFVIDSDPSQVGIESTIITIHDEDKKITILRPGIITSQDILACLGSSYTVETGQTAFETNQKVTAPGQFKAHYQPDFPLAYLMTSQFSDELRRNNSDCDFIQLDSNPYVTARELYSLMRIPPAEEKKRKCFVISEEISTLSDQEKDIWQGILNRLSKACTFSL